MKAARADRRLQGRHAGGILSGPRSVTPGRTGESFYTHRPSSRQGAAGGLGRGAAGGAAGAAGGAAGGALLAGAPAGALLGRCTSLGGRSFENPPQATLQMAHSPHRQALLCLLSRNMVADLERRARLTLRPLARPGSRRSFFASFSLSNPRAGGGCEHAGGGKALRSGCFQRITLSLMRRLRRARLHRQAFLSVKLVT